MGLGQFVEPSRDSSVLSLSRAGEILFSPSKWVPADADLPNHGYALPGESKRYVRNESHNPITWPEIGIMESFGLSSVLSFAKRLEILYYGLQRYFSLHKI